MTRIDDRLDKVYGGLNDGGAIVIRGVYQKFNSAEGLIEYAKVYDLNAGTIYFYLGHREIQSLDNTIYLGKSTETDETSFRQTYDVSNPINNANCVR